MTGYADKLQKKAAEHLNAGERLIAAVRTLPRGSTVGAAGGIIGAALSGRQASKAEADAAAGSVAEAWPKENAAVGLTDKRLLLFNYTAMGKPKDLIGEFPLDQLTSVELEKKKLGANALRFAFADGSGIEVECAKLEKTGRFVDAFKEARAGS
jgi:hypothetical protein